MKIKTTTYEYFELAEVRKPDAATVTLLLTVDCFGSNSPTALANELIYCDLLTAGSGEYSREEFQYKLSELGANITVSNNEGRITISLSALANKISSSLKLFELMLQKPSFKTSEQKRAVRSIKNAIELYKENARGLAGSALKNSFFKKGTRHFDHSPDVIKKAMDSVTNADVKAFHKQVLNNYWTIGIGASDKSVDEVLKTVKRLKHTGLPKNIVSTAGDLNNSVQVLQHEVKSKQNIEISFGNYLPLTLESPDLPAFMFGLAVLGKWGGFSGRLMSTVREKEGLTYMIYARIEGLSATEAGLWRIVSFFAPKDVVQGVKSTMREIKKIEQVGITESEWKRFKTILKTGDALVFDSLNSTTSLVHSKLVAGVNFAAHQEFREKLYSCTRNEVNKALKKYLNSNSLTISAAGPIANVQNELAAFAKAK